MSRTRPLGIILAVVFMIACAYLALGYMKQTNEQKALMARMSSVSETLALIPAPLPDLEQRLSETQQSYETARQNALPTQINSTPVIKSILAVAGEYNINVLPVTTEQWTTRAVDGNSYHVLVINLNTRGAFESIAEFTRRLDSEEFPYLTIDDINILFESEQESVKATYDLALFTQ